MKYFIILLAIVCLACVAACRTKGDKNMQPEHFFAGQMLELAKAIADSDTVKIASTIKAGANPNSYGKEGMTPLLFALGHKSKTSLKTLLENGADPNMRITAPDAIDGVKDESAVTFVAGATDNEYLSILLDHGGDVNAKNADGEPILITMIFVSPRNYNGISMLLDRGANINAKKSGGATLLLVLARLNDYEHVYSLLQKGADYRITDDGGDNVAFYVYQEKIDPKEFPEAHEWQRKCQEFLKARGVKDPGPMKPLSAEEQEEQDRRIEEAFEAQARKREQQ